MDNPIRAAVARLIEQRKLVQPESAIATSHHIVSAGFEHMANLCITHANGDPGACIAMTWRDWSDRLAATDQACEWLLPAFLALLDEREAWRRFIAECEQRRVVVPLWAAVLNEQAAEASDKTDAALAQAEAALKETR